MRYLSVSIILLLCFSNAFSESMSNNSASTGKIVIDGQEINNSKLSIKGSGIKETVSQKINNFSSINSSGSFDINYMQGSPAVTITGDSHIIKEVSVVVKENILQLSMKKSYSSKLPIVINISSPNIRGMTIKGASDVILDNINVAYLRLNLVGAVDLTASGNVVDLDLNVNGAGDVNVKNLIAKKVTVDLQGSGDVKLTAEGQLNATLSGAGDIVFFGNPSIINKRISGVGDIEVGGF